MRVEKGTSLHPFHVRISLVHVSPNQHVLILDEEGNQSGTNGRSRSFYQIRSYDICSSTKSFIFSGPCLSLYICVSIFCFFIHSLISSQLYYMASMRYGLNVETETTAPVEPISEASRRRRMEIHQFKFVPNDAAVVPPLENIKKKRRKLEVVIPLSPPLQCTNAVDYPKAKSLDLSASPFSSRIEADAVTECPKFGMTSVCGRRREMEDAVAIHPSFCGQNLISPSGLHFFGLYDGHGCSHVNSFCITALLLKNCVKIHNFVL